MVPFFASANAVVKSAANFKVLEILVVFECGISLDEFLYLQQGVNINLRSLLVSFLLEKFVACFLQFFYFLEATPQVRH